MSKIISCTLCGQEIEHQEDLITTIYGLFRIRPFHNECYGKAVRGKELLFMGRMPVNSIGFIVLCIVALIAMILFLFKSYYFLAAVMLIPIALRAGSWVAFERKFVRNRQAK